MRRRIPAAAIERVDVDGATGRQLTIVLTGDAPVTYRFISRSAPAVREFARVVHRALPVRDADEPQPDGAGLVTEEPLERAAPNRVPLLWWGLAAGYALVLVLLLVKGAGVVPTVLWGSPRPRSAPGAGRPRRMGNPSGSMTAAYPGDHGGRAAATLPLVQHRRAVHLHVHRHPRRTA